MSSETGAHVHTRNSLISPIAISLPSFDIKFISTSTSTRTSSNPTHSRKYLFTKLRSSSSYSPQSTPQDRRKYVRLSDPLGHTMSLSTAAAAEPIPASSSTLMPSSSQPPSSQDASHAELQAQGQGQTHTRRQRVLDPLAVIDGQKVVEIRNETKFSLMYEEHTTYDLVTGNSSIKWASLPFDESKTITPHSTKCIGRIGADPEEEKLLLTIWSTQQLQTVFIRISQTQTGWLWRKKRKTFVDASLQRDRSYHNLPLTFNVGRDFVVVSLERGMQNPFEETGRRLVVRIAHEKKRGSVA